MALKKAKDLRGIFVYPDEKYGAVYYDIFTKKGYRITNDDVQRFIIEKGLLPVAIIAFYLLYTFKVNIVLNVVITLAVYVIGQLLWRFLYLYKLQEVKKFVRPDEGHFLESKLNQYSNLRLGTLVALALAIAGIMIYLLTGEQQVTNVEKISYIVMLVLALALVLFGLFALIYKAAKNKNQPIVKK